MPPPPPQAKMAAPTTHPVCWPCSSWPPTRCGWRWSGPRPCRRRQPTAVGQQAAAAAAGACFLPACDPPRTRAPLARGQAAPRRRAHAAALAAAAGRYAPQEVCVLLHPRDAKGGALAAGADCQVVILNEEAQPVLCSRGSRGAPLMQCSPGGRVRIEQAGWQAGNRGACVQVAGPSLALQAFRQRCRRLSIAVPPTGATLHEPVLRVDGAAAGGVVKVPARRKATGCASASVIKRPDASFPCCSQCGQAGCPCPRQAQGWERGSGCWAPGGGPHACATPPLLTLTAGVVARAGCRQWGR
jgi:hypothetical protein